MAFARIAAGERGHLHRRAARRGHSEDRPPGTIRKENRAIRPPRAAARIRHVADRLHGTAGHGHLLQLTGLEESDDRRYRETRMDTRSLLIPESGVIRATRAHESTASRLSRADPSCRCDVGDIAPIWREPEGREAGAGRRRDLEAIALPIRRCLAQVPNCRHGEQRHREARLRLRPPSQHVHLTPVTAMRASSAARRCRTRRRARAARRRCRAMRCFGSFWRQRCRNATNVGGRSVGQRRPVGLRA